MEERADRIHADKEILLTPACTVLTPSDAKEG
jgi:hypothetical protein